MSRQAALKHYRAIFARWPQDTIRPDVPFRELVLARKEAELAPPSAEVGPRESANVDVRAETEQANALYSLLENRYSNKFKLTTHLLEPQSNPTYYNDLLKEIDEAPKRSWIAQRLNSWKGWLRWS